MHLHEFVRAEPLKHTDGGCVFVWLLTISTFNTWNNKEQGHLLHSEQTHVVKYCSIEREQSLTAKGARWACRFAKVVCDTWPADLQ